MAAWWEELEPEPVLLLVEEVLPWSINIKVLFPEDIR